ncbi:MAG TPA: hypothetical protein VK645_02055 [Chitinophagaceae bacterium]|nr:hypothetical protein [Chitinophagaceae bacterium]
MIEAHTGETLQDIWNSKFDLLLTPVFRPFRAICNIHFNHRASPGAIHIAPLRGLGR